jgi:large subunit ribosomal protein L15
MVIRNRSKSRKFLGSRSWGAGNIKNRRGSGSRGGVGRAGKKHKFTRLVKYEPERIRKKGFSPWNSKKLDVLGLDSVSRIASGKQEVEFSGYKILSNGSLNSPIRIKATAFSKKAVEKIKQAGGEAVKL